MTNISLQVPTPAQPTEVNHRWEKRLKPEKESSSESDTDSDEEVEIRPTSV